MGVWLVCVVRAARNIQTIPTPGHFFEIDQTIKPFKRARCTQSEHLFMSGVIEYSKDTETSKSTGKNTISDTTKTLAGYGIKSTDIEPFLWQLANKVARNGKLP